MFLILIYNKYNILFTILCTMIIGLVATPALYVYIVGENNIGVPKMRKNYGAI